MYQESVVFSGPKCATLRSPTTGSNAKKPLVVISCATTLGVTTQLSFNWNLIAPRPPRVITVL